MPSLAIAPPSRFVSSRAVWAGFWVAVIALKLLAIIHLRADSDETQHAHVVWAWSTGQLQYRDVFDNHMPLFQMACAPLFRLIGERADIIAWLRLAMLPLYLVSLWAVFRLATILFSRKAAPWLVLCAALSPWFFDTSTEFRTDDLWAALWLLSLVVAVSGPFTVKRALAFGLMLGLVFAVSMKTVVLVAALGVSTLVAMVVNWRRGGPAFSWGGLAARKLAILAGALVAPGALVLFFTWKGAFWIMYYCVVQHNVVPGLKRWGHFSAHLWIFPASIPILSAYAWLIFRQAQDAAMGARRVIVLLTPCFFILLLWSYWPDITREDDLPYAPLMPLVLFPLVEAVSGKWKLTYFFPALACLELVLALKINNLREDRLRVTTHSIADVLLLTHPHDYVMDNKGDYVFRPRPFYWVIETITKARIRMGLIHDDLPERLKATATKICYFYCGRHGTPEAAFIVANYIPFDHEALDLGVAGKEIGQAGDHFDVAIPVTYAVVSQAGVTTGELDGKPYAGPVFLAAGHHQFQRTSGRGRTAIILADAVAKGFHPQFQALDQITKRQAVAVD